MTITVLHLEGKDPHGSADRVAVLLFNTLEEAEAYCNKVTTEQKKHWTQASVITVGRNYEPYYDTF